MLSYFKIVMYNNHISTRSIFIVAFSPHEVEANIKWPPTGCQASLSEDERGELLRALHGGARHPAREAAVRDGHRGVRPTTQEVGSDWLIVCRGCVSVRALFLIN